MFPFTALLNPLAIIVSLSTATGVVVHDTRIDKATAVAMTLPAIMATYDAASTKSMNLMPDLHTHSERHSLSQSVNDLKAQNPRIQPRGNEDKKHLMQKNTGRGHHPFDNYNLPVVS